MKMTIEIKREIDLREVISHILANGLHYISDYGLDVDYSKRDYELAKENSIISNPSWEDVLTQIIFDGKSLSFVDIEGDGDMNVELTLESVQDGFKKFYGVNPTFTNAVNTLLEENDDADTCDVILQCLLYGDVTF